MQINSRSLNKNFDKLDNLIDSLDNKPDIISIAETWLKQTLLWALLVSQVTQYSIHLEH